MVTNEIKQIKPGSSAFNKQRRTFIGGAIATLLASSGRVMADNEGTPNDPFILLLTGVYQPVPMGRGPADNLGLTTVNLSDGSYSKTQIYPIFGVDGANDQKKAIGIFYVQSGRQTAKKAWVVIAAQTDGPGIGRIRMRMVKDCSAANLHPFVEDSVEPASVVHTDGWQGYAGLENKGYQREITKLKNKREEASKLMPRVHRVASLLKRWLLGTHQGGVAYYYLPYYLDEFTSRFNRRTSKSRGKLFFRLMQQAVNTVPQPYESMVGSTREILLSVGVD